MQIDSRDVGTVRVVRLSGALDAVASGEVRKQLNEVVRDGTMRLVIDLAGVSRIDSTGLGALVTTLKASRDRGGELVLAALTPAVRTVVELTRLHRVFDIYDDADAAAAELAR
jgi:anti-sigma B factor antagonist